MPRNGSGLYSLPAGTIVTTKTLIESDKFNAFVEDVAADLNAVRPVSAGGTGTSSAHHHVAAAIDDFEASVHVSAEGGIAGGQIDPNVLIAAISTVIGTGWQTADSPAPNAVGSIPSQSWVQGTAITPINLGSYFANFVSSVLMTPAIPGVTIGPSPTFTISGTPTALMASTSVTFTAYNTNGSDTQVTNVTTLEPTLSGRAAVDGLRYRATANGRTSTAALKTLGTTALPAGWSVSGNLVNVNAPFSGDIEDWDFVGKTLKVFTPIGAVRQCLFGETTPTGIFVYIDIDVAGRISTCEYNDFIGAFTFGGAGACITCRRSVVGADIIIGECPLIQYNRFEGYSGDAIKAVGSIDTAGQVIQWNYFGAPANLPQVAPATYSAGTTYALGDYVLDVSRNSRGMISKQAGNIGNPVPTGTVSDSWWTVLDPHSDAITTNSAVNKLTINNNLFDWLEDPDGALGPYFSQGLNNAVRISRNTGSNSRVDTVIVQQNVMRYDPANASYAVQVAQGVGTNFNGPISFVDNWIDDNSGGNYYHPSTNGWVNAWTNNRDATTDAVIASPTLRTSGAVPVNTVAPVVTGTASTFSTLTCTTGTWTGTATITYAYQWQVDGLDVSGATASTFYLDGSTAGASVQCIVTATNGVGSTTAGSNVITGITNLGITVDSASLKFPDGNASATTSGAPSYLADAANWAGTGAEIFASSAGAFAIMAEIPWEQIKMTSAQNMGLFGNISTSGTNPQIMGINISRGATDQEAYNLIFRLRDSIGNALVSTLPVTKAQKRLLCVFRFEAGAIQHEVYHQGVKIVSNAPAMGTFVGTRLRSQLLYGAQGSGTTDAYVSNASMYGFHGAIQFFGYNNTGLTQADCEAISLGADPLAQVAATGWRMYRRLTGTDTPSLTKQAACTNDATSPLVIYNARSQVFNRGSDLVPVHSGANWIDHDYIMDGFVTGRFMGAATGRIYLSGRANGITGLVEARVFDATGTVRKDWATVVGSTISGGLWSGYIDSPPNNQWGHIDIRPASTPAMVSRIRARTGVGIVINVGPSQSQLARSFLYPVTGSAIGSPGAVAVTDCPTFTASTYGLVSCVVGGERPYTGSLIAVANVIKDYTTEPVMIINGSKSGQNTVDLQSDATTAWNWTPEMEALFTQGCGPFAQRGMSVASLNWVTAFANNVNAAGNGIIGNNINPLFKGTFDVGASTYTVNHYLKDGLTFPVSTVYAVNPPMRYNDTGAGPFDLSGAGSNATTIGNHASGRSQWLTFAAAEGYTVGPWTDDINMSGVGGFGAGGPHPDILTDDGQPRALVRTVIGALWAMGINPKTNPKLGGVVRSGGGAIFTVSPILPNGGALQTAWDFRAIAVPAGETSVQGFEVQDGGSGAWSRSTFTTAITSGSVVLTKKSGVWAANTKVRYCANGPLDYGTSLDASNLFNGLLYESGIEEGGLGIPLEGLWTATA